MSVRDQSGYSLLELMVVLAIIGLITAIAVPSAATSLERMTLSANARDLVTQLRTLRETALDQQTEQVVTFKDGVFVLSNGATLSISPGTSAEVEGERFVVGADGVPGGAIRLARGGSSVRIVTHPLTGRIAVEVAR